LSKIPLVEFAPDAFSLRPFSRPRAGAGLAALLVGVTALSGLASLPVHARETAVSSAAPAKLTLERVFASPGIAGATPCALSDGRFVTVLRNRAEDRDRYDLWGFDRHTGHWRMLVDSARAVERARAFRSGQDAARAAADRRDLGVVSYDWSPDAQSVLVPVDGQLFLAHVAGKDARSLPVAAATGGEVLNPGLGPKGGTSRSCATGACGLPARRRGTGQRGTGGDARGKRCRRPLGRGRIRRPGRNEPHGGVLRAPDETQLVVERFDESGVGMVTRAAIGAGATG
jgi:dipeptidyl-peptidase-4